MSFKPGFRPSDEKDESASWFVFAGGKMLTRCENGRYAVPETNDLDGLDLHPVRRQYLGTMNGRPCYAAAWPPDASTVERFEFKDLRSLFGLMDEEWVWIAGRANQLVDWDRTHRFCGACGRPTKDKDDERAKICPQCGLINYPRLSPAVIVAVIKDKKKILLGRNKRFKLPMYSVLAGFVEPGETLEACVRREIYEEVGVSVKNIRYFGSQPWPFPNSLMIAFVAEHAGGEIVADKTEILEAAWFTRHNLPQIPPRISIARRLIDWFVNDMDVTDAKGIGQRA